MFSKTTKKDESNERATRVEPATPAHSEPQREQDRRTRSCSYLGPTAHFKGEITIEESLNIEGQFEGKIDSKSKTVTVGKQGRVNAEVHANIVEVRGTIEGDIHSRDEVQVCSTGIISGTIECDRLVVHDGAVFNGQISMACERAKKVSKGGLTLASHTKDEDKIDKRPEYLKQGN